MSTRTDAWVLHAGPAGDGTSRSAVRGTLSREIFRLPDLEDDEALVEPLYGSWEANIDHALSRQPIDVCRSRHEDPVILGNLGVVRVLRPARTGPSAREGDICIVMPFATRDRHGYAELVYAYDGAGIGILAKRTKLKADLLLPIPEHTRYSLPQWAAYARYFTAWDNWRVAHSCWLSQMDSQHAADALVFGWGGGVVFAELQLAQRAGFRVAMTASSDARLAFLTEHGMTAVDRRSFQDLRYDPESTGDNPYHLRRYRDSEARFLQTINTLSDGAGVAIFIDNIGSPLYRAVLKALSREGVLTSVGWKHGMRIHNLRASACIRRQLHVHTHVWRYGDSARIRDYQEDTGWMPTIDVDAIYDFDDVPQLAADYEAGKFETYFPLFRVNSV
ncbi:MAG: zinc-binding alcohol dehydrogenase family protein [Dactylosporangium sp.]|nr:zinc-binding dehydrogenase [Dactylosporangium sp.]NNJ62233.1 zinc-binding alcohol dehydrogenase family protein [Dactylosporangium sp.]